MSELNGAVMRPQKQGDPAAGDEVNPVAMAERTSQSIDQSSWLRHARALLQSRHDAECRQAASAAAAVEERVEAYVARRDETIAAFQEQHGALAEQYRDARETLFCRYERAAAALAREQQRELARLADQRQQALADADTLSCDRQQHLERTFDQRMQRADAQLEQFRLQCEQAESRLQEIEQSGRAFVERWCAWPTAAPAAGRRPDGKQADLNRCVEAMHVALKRVDAVRGQSAVWFLREGGPALVFVLALPLLAYPSWLLVSGFGAGWSAAACIGGAILAALASRQLARRVARHQVARLVPGIQAAVQAARSELLAAREQSQRAAEVSRQRSKAQREAEAADVFAQYAETCAALQEQYEQAMNDAEQRFAAQRTEIEQLHEAEFDDLERMYDPRIERLESDLLRTAGRMHGQLCTEIKGQRADCEQQRAQWDSRWRVECQQVRDVVMRLEETCRERFPAWHEWNQQQGIPQNLMHGSWALPIGRFQLRELGGLSAADDQATDWPASMPAVLAYPQGLSLGLKFTDQGRDAAHAAMRNIMLRMLTALPPGKLRFTIIDPVGLGGDFAAFMHLADDDPRLVSGRIWTESNHIQQQLGILTDHIENVLQKYLRNEFASLDQYNAQAGEVAEPLHVLVIADFPTNFTDESARRLASILSRGPRCGVYTLISVDSSLKLPRECNLAQAAANLVWLEWQTPLGRFTWQAPELENLPLELESPPSDERFSAVLRAIGQRAKHAARVEVPFATIAPAAERWWTADSRAGLEVALGRAGAKNLQRLQLGSGTSQHVLVAGKTGSGKSSLLHAVVTNLALHYPPDQLEFYLVDFKKGVEFKAYATHGLPHARVIAIESEREFGMSVLERLDVELQTRGELFRRQGVQDLRGYRDAAAQQVLPRILLVIDEFQEFFTADDRIAHDASLLLDRLVRQGRAFGIHVLLGSQTLAGAYSLARSTLGQIAVRIALQCSESDAHLILSEENTAARWLSRPGEAIYNDTNGLIEGNHLFQVAWLPDAQREQYLTELLAHSRSQGWPRREAVVFEGNASADPADNVLIQQLLSQPPRQTSWPLRAWLGAPVAIKDPTVAELHPQSGNNLLIVGQQEELAFGMLASSVVALDTQIAAPHTNDSAAAGEAVPPLFWVLDGSPGQAQQTSPWRRFATCGGRPMRHALPRDTSEVMDAVGAEVQQRVAEPDAVYEPCILVLYNVARLRELKKADDFGFSSGSGETPAERLAMILRDGPAVGVHVLAWCDTYNTASRWFERQTLRDFELRVAMQMSPTDSSNFIDSPAASRLGSHGAILYRDESGTSEKFRPYRMPSEQWPPGERWERGNRGSG